jgi:hypothetical protein
MGSTFSTELHVCHIREENIRCESEDEPHNHIKYYIPNQRLEFYICRGNIIMYRCLLSTDEFIERYVSKTNENTVVLSDSMYDSIREMRKQLRFNSIKFNKQLLCDILDWKKFQIKNEIEV